jgi:uncharacterized protein YjdB
MHCRTALAWALASLTALVACELPTRPPVANGPEASRLAVSPKALILQQNQSADFTAIGFTTAGDTADVAISWSATSGTITDTSTDSGRHRGRYRAGADTGKVKVVAKGQPGGPADTAVVTVTLAPVVTVAVSPAAASVAVGGKVTLAATPLDVGGNALAGRVVTWASTNPGVAAVNGSGVVTGVAAGAATITAACEGQSGTAAITVTVVPVASIAVSPAAASVTTGQTVQLTATPKDANGNPLTGRTVTWATSNVTVATVSGNGLVAGGAAGTATITASSEGQNGTAAITVTLAPVASVVVSPAAVSITVGRTAQLTATPKDANGNSLTGRVVTWASSAPGVATVSASGLVTGVAAGTATLTATSEGKSGTATVTVTTIPVASVSVSPASASLRVGGTVQLAATPKDSAGNSLSGRVVTWASSASGVATVSASGLVTGVAAGTATLTATSEGKSGTATVTVTAVPVASVTVSPASSSVTAGQTVQLSATLKDSAGNALTGRVVTWASSATGVATVSASGLVTGVTAGSATLTATSEGKSGTATVTVTVVPVASVAVTPSSASVQAGQTVQLTATPKDANGNALTGRTVAWATSNAAVATVSASGLVTGVVAGTATITATSEGKSGSAAITVSVAPPPPPHSGYYVATNGTSGGDGSASQPWALSYALGGAGGRIQPGDTVWVRGGTYFAPFRSTLTGTASAPIVVRAYPGERPIIDGVNATSDNFVVAGSWSVIWGLEFTNTMLSRYTDLINHDYRPDNIVNNGPHNRYVNLVIHDGGVAFFNYSVQSDVEIYGSIIYNNGWQAPDRGHGHGMYLKSDVGPLVARDNVIFNQFGYGIHVYTNTGSGLLNNIHAEGNVSFDNGSLSSTGTSANIGNLGQPLANTLGVQDNMTYFAPSLSGSNLVLGSGDGLVCTGNYVVGGAGISEGTWTNATVTGNTELSASATGAVRVFVRPNRYEPGRANVIVYNPSGQGSVTVDLSAVVPPGVRYEVRNVQDLFGAPVASGTGGGAISLPMSGVRPPTPVGMSSSPAPTTGPYFNVFVVTIVSQ